jgi:hypothetical protein
VAGEEGRAGNTALWTWSGAPSSYEPSTTRTPSLTSLASGVSTIKEHPVLPFGPVLFDTISGGSSSQKRSILKRPCWPPSDLGEQQILGKNNPMPSDTQNKTGSTYLYKCCVCLNDELQHSETVELDCRHIYCHTCLKYRFRLSILQPTCLRCYEKGNKSVYISLKCFREVMSNESIAALEEKIEKNPSLPAPVYYCRSPGCERFVQLIRRRHKQEGYEYGECRHCDRHVCLTCFDVEYHRPQDCPERPLEDSEPSSMSARILRFFDALGNPKAPKRR